jgi:hypothetical protein
MEWWWNEVKNNIGNIFMPGGGIESQRIQSAFDYVRSNGNSGQNKTTNERNYQNNDSNFYESAPIYTCINGHQINSYLRPKKCPFCDKTMYPKR